MTEPIHPATAVGPVALTVRDLDRCESFYEGVLGMSRLPGDGPTTRLGTADGRPLVELVADPAAPPRPPRTTGLFHLAILVPDRRELARALNRAIETRWPLAGASDHLVSEALYLSDPEGNGIEIYSDRPPKSWRREGGEIAMATLPLDLRGVMAELDGGSGNGVPQGTAAAADDGLATGSRVGHVHLDVADLGAAEAFYAGLLGFDVTARGYPGALFLSAGGYHHHVGVNTWSGEGAPPPPDGSAGLRAFELTLPSLDAWESVVGRLREGGVEVGGDGDAAVVRDPSRNVVVLRVAPD